MAVHFTSAPRSCSSRSLSRGSDPAAETYLPAGTGVNFANICDVRNDENTRVENRVRCAWAGSDAVMTAYHDEEWGVPVHDDRALFEFLILEGAQAGLSWSTILKKRRAYRTAFDHFNPRKVARYTEPKIAALL